MKWRHIAGWGLVFLGCLVIYQSAMACWVFRDGMGPDAIESHGRVAFERFMEDFWLTALISIAVIATGFWLIFARKKEPIQASETTRGKRP